MERIEININSTNTESSSGDTNDNRTLETQISEKDSTSDLCSINFDTINKSDCENQEGENISKIDEEEERKSIPDSLIDAKTDSWVARLEKDNIKEEQLPLLSNNNDSKPAQPLPVKVNGLRESYRGGEVHYSVIRGSEVIIASKIVETDSDFIIDREYDEHKLNYYKIRSASKNNEGVYNWELQDNSKQGKQTGSFNITICG
ncbi:hypothetical protein AM593_08521, partial [Mytilus galloprovincialis]